MAHTKVTKTYSQNTGTANTFSYSGSFDVFKASEIEVELANIKLTFTTGTINESASPREYTVDYGNKTIRIGGADLTSSDTVVIQPITDMGAPTPRATYEPGASITSTDLNNNQLQLMRKVMEYDEQLLSTRGGTMTGNLHLGQNVDLTFEGDTDNAYETTLTVADPTSDKTITLPDTTGTVVTTGDTATVTATMLAANSVDSSELVDGSIDTSHIGDSQVTEVKLGSSAVTTSKLATDAVTTAKITDANVTTAKIANDAVTADKLAHTAVTAGSYTATDLTVDDQGRITAAANGVIAGSEIAADAIDGSKIADDSIDSEHYVAGSVDTTALGADAVTGAKIADDAINSEHYTDGSIDTDHIADLNVTTAKLADASVTTVKIADANVTTAKITDANVTTDKIADSNITTVKIADSNITTAKIAADAVTNAKIADDSIDSEHYVDGSIDTDHIAGAQVTDAKLASNSVTTSKITDGNVTTVKIADSGITLAKLTGDLRQPTISNSNTEIPTSGAVVNYVAAQLAPIGGLEVIADEVSFPDSQPSAGVVISISDAAGVVVNGSGVSTTGRTVSNSTVTINNFPSSLNGETLVAGVGLMVSSTGSSQTYNYHKILAAENDVKRLSDDINDFNARYRVGSSNPTSALDNGDLFFNTGTGKMMVYNGINSAWEVVQSVGNFFINTISSSSGTGGGSATFNGSAYRFTLSNAGADAQQMLVSVNGVIQKPNAGTSQPSEGFAIDGSDIIFAAAPASSSDYFIITIGASVNIGAPSDNTVTTAKLTSGAVTTAKIADDNVTTAKIADSAVTTSKITDANVTTAKIADDAVTAAKLASDAVVSASIVDGSIVNADINASAAIARTKLANVDVVDDTSPQLGGDLQSNGNDIDFADNDKAIFGTGSDLKIYHDGTENFLEATGNLIVKDSSHTSAIFDTSAEVQLYYDNSKKFETTSSGSTLSGDLLLDSASAEINLKAGSTGQTGAINWTFNTDNTNYSSINVPYDTRATDGLVVDGGSYSVSLKHGAEYLGKFIADGAVELYYDNSKKFETTSGGVTVTGGITTTAASTFVGDLLLDNSDHSGFDILWDQSSKALEFADGVGAVFGASDDLQIYHDASNSIIKHDGTGDLYIDASDSSSLLLRSGDGGTGAEAAVVCNANAAVELYHSGTKKFETTNLGAQITGELSLTTHLKLLDDQKVVCGDGEDLLIYHDGTHSRINNSTGYLTIKSDQFALTNGSGDHDYITVPTAEQNVRLHYDNAVKFETRSDGAFIYGLPKFGSYVQAGESGTATNNFHFGAEGDGTYRIYAKNYGAGDVLKIIQYNGESQHFYTSGVNTKEIYHWSNNTTGMSFRSANTQRGNIYFYDTGVQFNTSSDYRLKENVTSISDGITRVKQLIPRKFNWIIDESNTPVDGFLAHEVSSIVPEAINGTKDAVATQEDVDSHIAEKVGDPIHQMIDHSKLVPLLTSALQEAITKIETLETKVAALEAA